MGYRGYDGEGEGAACGEVGELRKVDEEGGGDEMQGPPSLIREDIASMRYMSDASWRKLGLGIIYC